ncbi:MAG: hypothetical protein IKM31_08065 [Oscillospiraceae bacterium]|nr:hypothetical protein [Oscillospiraceae bacterium]
MNKIERMKAVFAGKEPDHVPAGFWFHYPEEYTAEECAVAHLKLYRELDNDIIKIMDDCFGYSIVKDVRIEKSADWLQVTLPGRESPQYQKMEKVIRILFEEVGEEVMIFPTMWSPFKLMSWAYIFNGSDEETFMRHCAEDPASIAAGAKKIADVLCDWAEGYLKAGASGMYYSCQFSEPQRFTNEKWAEVVRPSDLQMLNRMKELGGYSVVHICGEAVFGHRSSPARYADYPGDLFNWDVHCSGTTLEEGRAIFKRPILGGLDNHGLMAKGTLEEIAAETVRLIGTFGKKGYMIGADCTVPSDIDTAKLKAAVDAAKNA